MKACVIQAPYSRDTARADELFAWKLQQLDACDASMDIIVLPEYSDVPCATTTREETLYHHRKYIGPLLDKCAQTARRCSAHLFVNALSPESDGYRNTTYCYNREGQLAGKYFKRHLPAMESEVLGLAEGYTYESEPPYVLELDGIRYGFLTCYDFYFYEAFARIARERVDVIIGCSLQRSDSHDAIEIMCRFLAYQTNAYVLRSSVSFDEASHICGASMIVDPSGRVLANMAGRFGMATAEFDPGKKYLKPAGFGNAPAPHYEYVERGRKPWQYRLSGSAIVPDDDHMPYPRVCAHRGFSTIAPENSMPAYGAAIAMGADEIELDLRITKDGEIVSCHDSMLERISSGEGNVSWYAYDELKELDFGSKFSERYAGLKIMLFEDILKKFAGQVIMNVHIKTDLEEEDVHLDTYDPRAMRKIVDLVRKYDCARHVYFMCSSDDVLRMFRDYAPDIKLCVGHSPKRPWEIVERAIELGAEKVQLYKDYLTFQPYYNREMVEKAHAHGIICNVFWSDDPDETRALLDMGIDTILTNDFNLIHRVVKG